jgi:ligand-binding sensor domain-containing protein/DNA-binding CsgD family transcriptional regulator
MFVYRFFNSTLLRSVALLLLFLLSSHVHAQFQSIGSPLVQNFSKSQYHSGNKNWSVSKDKRGIMYFGNSEGLLVYDGSNWQLYPTKNNLIIRSVTCDSGNKVYTGAYGEFGYWSYNTAGRFVYTSLVDLLAPNEKPQDEIWKIYIDGNRILFQSFAAIYIYEAGKIDIVRANNAYLFLLPANNRFFIEVHNEGLYELKGKKLELVKGSEFLGKLRVLSVLPYNKESYLIGTANSGIYIYDGKQILPWHNQANEFLKASLLNNGSLIQGKYYAYGTILNGIVILDEEGNTVQKINKASGLQNNTVLNLYTDNEQNLWAGLDNGIDRIELNSPLSFYFDKTGKFGTVYASTIFNGNIYLGTNQGLFYSKWYGKNDSALSLNFELVNNSQGQVWSLYPIDGQLICGHNDGTFRVENDRLIKIGDIKGGWTIKRSTYNPKYLIQGTYNGIAIYTKDSYGNWVFDHRIKGFTQPSRYVEQDYKGQLWVSHAYKGVSKLVTDEEFNNVVSIKNYDEHSGLPSAYNINIFTIDNRILFSSSNGFYLYDELTNYFTSYTYLNKKLGNFASSNRIIKAADNRYWFINHGKMALCTIGPGTLQIDSSKFTMLKDHMVQLYENVTRINDHIYLISIDDGFTIFEDNNNYLFKAAFPKVLIRKVEDITDKLTLISENENPGKMLEISYRHNNIRIEYSLPYYRQSQIKYQYYLEGYSNGWSDWSRETKKDFTNLNPGDYVFKVSAKIDEGPALQQSIFRFRVLKPWYTGTWALVVYALLFIGLLLALRKYYKIKLAKQHRVLEEKLQLEASEALKRETIANEQKIMLLKNEQLKSDLASKNRQLASSAMNVVHKNEHLQKIKDDLMRLRKASANFSTQEATELRKIIKLIDGGMDENKDWSLFEASFNEAHIDFLKKLKSNHPTLLPTDLKICAYLRMNMSSKEIASLLKITVRGVEIRRYRLRKKLNLEHDRNLVEYLMGL